MKKMWATTIAVFVFINLIGFINVDHENVKGAATIPGGHITTNTTWFLSQSPYYIEGNVTVDENVKLTIESGVIVKFNKYCGLYIEGSLDAIGLPDNMINFTSNASSPSANDWERIQINSTGHVDISYCNLTYANYSLYLSYSSNNNITNNNISFHSALGIYLDNSNNNVIKENAISSGINTGMELENSSGNKIIANDIFWNDRRGIELTNSSDDNKIINNNIVSNNLFGINIWNSSNNTLMGNNLTLNNIANIVFFPSSYDNLILNNKISSTDIGIDLSTTSRNTVIGNEIYSHFWTGIYAASTTSNIITNNNISNNDFGIYIYLDAHLNRIYHNNFFNNTIQVVDEEADNFWNDSYPSGGNYWSDYNGTDLNSTSSQDVPPPDGIGDTPYVIDSDSQDNYPLMEPYSQDPPSAPQNLQALTGDSYVNLTWSPPLIDGGSQITGYYIYQNGTAGVYATVAADQLWYNDTNAVNGIEYIYNVSAINSMGGGPNTTTSAIPMTTPTAPLNPDVLTGYNYVNLSWDPSISDGGSPIIEYWVYRNATVGQYAVVPASQLWYNDTAVDNGTTYTYYISAVNGVGEGEPSIDIIATTPAPSPPTEPLNPLIESGNGYVNLSWGVPIWDGDSPITSYNIYRNGTIGIYDTISAIQRWYNDTNVINYVTYTYNITATNDIGEGPNSVNVPATPSSPTIPEPPENPQVQEGDRYVYLTWEIPLHDGNSPIIGYYIYRNGTAGFFASVPSTQLWYLDLDVINDVTYTYNFTAINGIGEGLPSPDVDATPFNITVPLEPLDPRTQAGNSFVNLTWLPPIYDGGELITLYNIYRNDASGVYNSVSYDQLWFLDANVTNGINYSYRIAAENAIGEGAKSTEVWATPMTVPSAPRYLLLEIGNGFLNLSWGVPSDDGGSPINGYNIYRDETSSLLTYVPTNEVLDRFWIKDSGVVPGTAYMYWVSAVNDVGEGTVSNPIFAKAGTTPSAPIDEKAASGESIVNLTWSAPVFDGGYSISAYIIYRGVDPGHVTFLDRVGDIHFYSDSNVTNGVTYHYRISVVNLLGEGELSEIVNATPYESPAPTNQPPTCSIISPSQDFILQGTEVVEGAASDIDGSIQRVEVRIGEGEWITAEGTNSWNYSLDTTSLRNSEYIIYARSYDGTNFSSITSLNIRIDNPKPGTPDKSIFEEFWSWILIVMIIIILILFLIIKRKKGKPEEDDLESKRESEMKEEINGIPEDDVAMEPASEENNYL